MQTEDIVWLSFEYSTFRKKSYFPQLSKASYWPLIHRLEMVLVLSSWRIKGPQIKNQWVKDYILQTQRLVWC